MENLKNTKNYHFAKIHDPNKYTDFGREALTRGLDVVYGKKNKKSEIQAYRFHKDEFTPEKSKIWLKEHNIKYYSFIKAGEESKKIFNNSTQYAKKFEAILIEPGITYYNERNEVVLLKKETLDKYINTFKGRPVTIGHKNGEVASDFEGEEQGYIFEVWFDAETGKYKGNGLIHTDEAMDLIRGGYYVSTGYKALKIDRGGGKYNNNKYDAEVLEFEGTHLALTTEPRYNDCEIFLTNSLKNEEKKEVTNMIFFNKTKEKNKSEVEYTNNEIEDKKDSSNEQKEEEDKKTIEEKTFKEEDKKDSSNEQKEEEDKKYVGMVDQKNKEKEKNLINEVSDDDKIKIDGEEIAIKDLIDTYEAEQLEKEKYKELQENSILNYKGKKYTYKNLLNSYKNKIKNSNLEKESQKEIKENQEKKQSSKEEPKKEEKEDCNYQNSLQKDDKYFKFMNDLSENNNYSFEKMYKKDENGSKIFLDS